MTRAMTVIRRRADIVVVLPSLSSLDTSKMLIDRSIELIYDFTKSKRTSREQFQLEYNIHFLLHDKNVFVLKIVSAYFLIHIMLHMMDKFVVLVVKCNLHN